MRGSLAAAGRASSDRLMPGAMILVRAAIVEMTSERNAVLKSMTHQVAGM
jgi:hypothetical protein